MARFNTGNPLGSADPRDRDDNSKNLDEAVNDLNSATWIDRLGVERTTISRVEGLAEAAAAIVGGGDDITAAWRSAIDSNTLIRVADSPTSYTDSLASGEATEREPIPANGNIEFLKTSAISGAAFSILAPRIVAIRKFTALRSGSAFRVDLLAAESGEVSGELNDVFYCGIAWYDEEKNRLSSTPSTEFFRDTIGAQLKLAVTVRASGGDVDIPPGAVYMTPYVGTDSTEGRFFASELTVSDVTFEDSVRQGAGVEYKGYCGSNPASFTFDVADKFARSVDPSFAMLGATGERIGIVADSSRGTVGTMNLLPLSKSGEMRYDIHYSASILSSTDGDFEVSAAWFDSNKDYISESVGLSFPAVGTLQAFAENVVRSHKFEVPSGAVYARPFVRLSGSSGSIAVLTLFAQPSVSNEWSGPSSVGLPSRLLSNAQNAAAYDPVDGNSVHVSGTEIQSITDTINGSPIEALGGAYSKPVSAVVGGYKCISTIGQAPNARMTIDSGATYGPGILVFAAYMDSSASGIKSLIHGGLGEDDGDPSAARLRINANSIRGTAGDWITRPGRVGIAIDGVTDGRSGDGNPLAAYAIQDAWHVFSLVFKQAPARSQFWCNGELVDEFTMTENLTVSRRTDLFQGSVFDADGVAIGRICSSDIDATDDERIQLERWAAEPVGKPMSINRVIEKPVLDVTSACAMRVSDGAILFEQDPYARQNIASLTKIFTGMLADQWVKDFDEEICSPIDSDGAGMFVGDTMSITDSVSLMLIPSNDACSRATGRRVGEIIQAYEGVQNGETPDERGYREMNRIGRSIGMVFPEFTSFIAGDVNITQICSLDVCRALSHINSSKRLMDIMGTSRHTATITDVNDDVREVEYITTNSFLSFNSNRRHTVLAGKTGTTAFTGQQLGILMTMPGGDVVALALTGSPTSPDRYEQMSQIMEYVERKYYQ